MHRAFFIGPATAFVLSASVMAARNQWVSGFEPVLSRDLPKIGLVAFKGDVVELRRLISAGANIESTGKDRRTPLLLAAAGGHYDAVITLLKAGATVNARDSSGATALHWAALRGEERIALLLLSRHAEVNIQDDGGATPLMLAAIAGSKTIVEALMVAGANPELTDADGLTARAWAKKNNYIDIVSLLAKDR